MTLRRHSTEFFGVIRIALALWVFVNHFDSIAGRGQYLPLGPLRAVIANGSAPVQGFMLITGFLMAQQCFRMAPGDDIGRFWAGFMVRRLFRLYPVYLLAITVALTVKMSPFDFVDWIDQSLLHRTLPAWIEPTTWSPLMVYLVHAGFLQGFWPNMSAQLLAPTWSLALEMQFYVAIPFLVFALFRGQRGVVLFCIVAGIMAQLSVFPAPLVLLQAFLNQFAIGTAAAAFVARRIGLMAFGIALGACLAPAGGVAQAVDLAILALLFADTKPLHVLIPMRRVLSRPLFAAGGELSYAVYLLHPIVMAPTLWAAIWTVTAMGGSTGLGVVIGFVIAITMTVGISQIVHLRIEVPFRTWGKDLAARFATVPRPARDAIVAAE